MNISMLKGKIHRATAVSYTHLETPYHKGDTKMDYNKLALEMHEQNKGKIAVRSKVTAVSYTHLAE